MMGYFNIKLVIQNTKCKKIIGFRLRALRKIVIWRELRKGVDLGDFKTLPAEVKMIDEPAILWERIPPIRDREK
jgi:hypothetical protein